MFIPVECLNRIGWWTFWGVQLFSGKRTENVVPGILFSIFITQVTVDYKRVLLKENPFPFHAVSNGTTWKRNVIRPEKENNLFTQERWRLQEDQQSFTYQSEYCSKSGTNILKRWNCNHLTETSRSSTEVNTLIGASSDEKGWRKSTCKFTAVI